MIDKNLPRFPLISADFYTTRYQGLNEELKESTKLKSLAKSLDWDFDLERIEEEFLNQNKVILVTNPQLHIVHATSNIFQMNGYKASEIIGQSPKIFQGEKTSKSIRSRIAKAIKSNKGFDETLINYKKDQSLYKCWITGFPVKNKKGEVVNFIAFEKAVA
ncbi:PAS domain-containing protein [Croceivirga thetidis]|uniref:PAS domain-containing protein n=1 Tax=Croceivirga thetidis TaxID=2721623 RepID=A0ABX1GR15_9FLAO|nr:PAS domain-containing protein [Croceivirga thetidis]NKI31380.1 PAS domain-containing protein [Croceivirga thetidis]